jgi:hypothetical protein
MHAIYELALGIALQASQGHSSALGLSQQAIVDVVKGLSSVNRGLPLTEQVKVGAVYYQNV